jgi:hypothetical protein
MERLRPREGAEVRRPRRDRGDERFGRWELAGLQVKEEDAREKKKGKKEAHLVPGDGDGDGAGLRATAMAWGSGRRRGSLLQASVCVCVRRWRGRK